MPSTSWGGNPESMTDLLSLFREDSSNFNQVSTNQYKSYASPEKALRRYYFNGYNSMSEADKRTFDERYPEINSISPEKRDNFFRNKIFTELFKDSENPEDQEIWNNRHSLTKRDRDDIFARKAIEDDIDGVSNMQESSVDFWDFLKDHNYAYNVGITKGNIGKGTARRQSMEYLERRGSELYNQYYDVVSSLDTVALNEAVTNLSDFSKQISPSYAMYAGTDKLNQLDMRSVLAKYLANEAIGGSQYAAKALAEYYQNEVASKQSLLEKAWNSGAQFIDSAIGEMIRGVGMAGAALGFGREDDESWLANVIDNDVTRYGDRVATTNTYDWDRIFTGVGNFFRSKDNQKELPASEQERLEGLGLSDNPILNTVDQQNSLVSWNTPFELFGQYGFTVGSTLLSFGATLLPKLAVKTAAWASKIAMGGKTLNASQKGVSFLRKAIKTEKIANVLVPGAVGTVEGGMNAAATRRETLEGFEQDIQTRYSTMVDSDIDAYAREHNMSQEQADYLKSNPESRAQFESRYAANIEADRQAAEESANTAMYWDFTINSVINGMINATWKAGLEAPRVQNALRKSGLGSNSNSISESIQAVQQGNRWTAQARRMTKGQAFLDRIKESFGESIEEYTQDISSAFAQGYAEDKMHQYVDNKYTDNPGTFAAQNDFWQSFAAGLVAAGNSAISSDAIKSGLYGALSTAMGGPNIGMRYDDNGNVIGKGITWRSSFAPLVSNKAINRTNKQREKLAEHFNKYFSDENIQRAFFDVGGTAEWMTQYQRLINSGDEKSARDAKIGWMFSNIITLNDLEGTGYREAVMANLQARAGFNANNLQNSESEESIAVDQFMASAQNRTQNISREEALQTIQKNASEMLNMIDMVEKESKSIEKVFGENLDHDVKSSMVFNKVVIDDYKKRTDQLDKELSKITAELNSQGESVPSSSLGAKSKKLIASFGSLSNATDALAKLEKRKAEYSKALDKELEHITNPSEEQKTLISTARAYIDGLNKMINDIKAAQEDYKFEARQTPIEREGITYNTPVDTTVLSASEIMSLSAIDRANMLNPKNRNRYSQEQQAEIDKVNTIGTSIYQDFTKKIADRGRVEIDYRAALNSQFSLMSNPKALNRYITDVKYKAQQLMMQKKNEELLDLAYRGNYLEFSERLDDIYNRGDEAEIAAVKDMLTRGSYNGWFAQFPQQATAMFNRYSEENDRKDNIYDWAENNKIFSENDERADVFAAMLDYLSNNGIDITNIESGVQKLLETVKDEEGNEGDLSFEHYLARVNEESPIEKQVRGYKSIEEAIQTYKDIMSRYNSDMRQKEIIHEEIIPTETPEEASNPAEIPDPTPPSGPTIFNIGGSSPEEGYIGSDGEVVGSTTVSDMVKQGETETPALVTEAQAEKTQSNPIIATFIENSNEEVGQAAEIAIKTASNIPSFSTEAKEKAKNIIEGMAINSFDNVQEFTNALVARANAIDSMAEEGETQVSAILRQIAANLIKGKLNEEKKATTPSSTERSSISPFFDKRRRAIRIQTKRVDYQFTVGNPDSGMITSMNMTYLRQNYPDSPTTKYYEKYGIEDALQDGVLDMKSTVMFITDDALTSEVKAYMKSKGYNYTDNSLPIIAVVESPDGPVTINVDGQDKHFQPVSIMSATGFKYSPGSNNMAPIRKLAAGNTGTALVKNTDGSPVTTKLFRPVIAIPSYDSSRKGQDNNNVLDVGQNDLSEQEKGTAAGYQKAKKNFLKGLDIDKADKDKDSNDKDKLVYRQNKLNGETTSIRIFFTPVQRTQNREGETVSQVRDNANKLINFNSRTRRAAGAIRDFIKNFSEEGMSFARGADGNIVLLGETKSILDAKASAIRGQVSNFLHISSKSGWNYSVTATAQVVDGKRVYSIDLVNSNNPAATIHLTNIHQGMSEEENKVAQHEFLKNLLMDESGNIRMSNNRDSFVSWNVPFGDVKGAKEGNERAKKNLSDIYDDGFLEVSASNVSFKYIIQGIALRNPFDKGNTSKTTTVANPTNASPAAPVNAPVVVPTGQVVKDSTVIDSDTGTVVQGEAAPATNPAAERAKEIVDRIVSDSKSIKLSDDGSAYVDGNGTRYARVTSIIAADEEAGERFDSNSPWATPSTNIGTGIDEFVRDFFAGVATDFSKYPNATPEALQKFAEQLTALKNSLTASGLTVVPRDVTVTGQVEVADSDGKVHTINVAGTLDLLAYDGKGNFYIFDMKTNRSGIDQHKREKYARQLSLYKDFLERKYGVQVKALNIIPIGVSYPAPVGWGNGTANYSVSPEGANQLLIDGKEYREANPILQDLIGISYKPLKVVYDRLTDQEKSMLSGIEETLNEGTGVIDAPVEPVTPIEAQVADPTELPINSILGVAMDMSVGNNLFEDEFTGSGWDMNRRLTPIPHHLQWNNLTQEQRDGLMAKHITEESWSMMEDQEMEQDLGCL